MPHRFVIFVTSWLSIKKIQESAQVGKTGWALNGKFSNLIFMFWYSPINCTIKFCKCLYINDSHVCVHCTVHGCTLYSMCLYSRSHLKFLRSHWNNELFRTRPIKECIYSEASHVHCTWTRFVRSRNPVQNVLTYSSYPRLRMKKCLLRKIHVFILLKGELNYKHIATKYPFKQNIYI